MSLGLSGLLRSTDPFDRVNEQNERARQVAKEKAFIEVTNEIRAKQDKFNPLNAAVGALTGFVTTGFNPVGAVSGGVSAGFGQKGETDILRSAQSGFAGGATGANLAGIVSGGGAPKTGTTSQATTAQAPGFVGPPAPPVPQQQQGLDFGRLISPQNIQKSLALTGGLASGRPEEGLAAARQIDITKEDRKRAIEKDELSKELTRAQINKLNSSIQKLGAPENKNGVFQTIKGRKQLVDKTTGELIKDFGLNVSADDITKGNQGLFSVKQIRTILDPVLDDEKKFAELQGKIASTKGGLFATQEGRKLRGSFRNAIDVILRKRTGAVISPSEFENAMESWGLQVGDDPSVINKKLNDLEAMLKLSSGELDPSTPEGLRAEQELLNLSSLTAQFQEPAEGLGGEPNEPRTFQGFKLPN